MISTPHRSVLRVVLQWQFMATIAIAALGGMWAGMHGALSAVLGGAINMSAGVLYFFLIMVGMGGGKARGANVALIAMFRAEAGKVLAIIAQLWLVLSTYRDIVPAAFFSAFALTVIAFAMALTVRD